GMSARIRREGLTSPLAIEFSPALPLGSRLLTSQVAVSITAGDVHATLGMTMTAATAELRIPFEGGWSIVPPAMPAVIGRRSEAPRVLSERLGADGRYTIALEGIAGRTYSFRLRAPSAPMARAIKADVTAGVARLSDVPANSRDRGLAVTFPAAGANADGYTAVTLSVR
ncbi:MAG TPA: hypothetical protein VFO31_09765, partial [Vicinamibacterales bacterium]|nr:hypothetical protein [Vicinamibacterales bacterium]